MDIAISFPSQGQIRLESRDLFAEPGNETCRQFLERVFQAPEITDVTINSHQKTGELPHADLRFCHMSFALPDVVQRISTCLDPARKKLTGGHHPQSNGLAGLADRKTEDPQPSHAHNPSPRDPGSNGVTAHAPSGHASNSEPGGRAHHGVSITRVTPIRNEKGQIRFFRYGSAVTNWEVMHEIPGRLRIKNSVVHRKSDLCQAIERELMSVLGVDSYKTNPLTSTVLVQYDPKELTRDQIIEIIDGALATAEHPPQKDRPDLHLPLCTVSMPLAAAAQFAAPGCCPWPRACSLTPRSPPSRTPAQ